MYADDTNITAYHTNINAFEDVPNKDLDILYRWLQAYRLSLNVLKIEYMYMLIGFKVRINKLTSAPKRVIGGHRLKRVVVTKSLGLMIDDNLSFEEHVNYMSKKVAKGLAMLRRIRDLLPINTLVDIYSSIILPHFDYCSSVWDNCRKGARDKLQKLQNRAARIIIRSNYEIRSSQILNKLNWPTLEDRRMKQKSCLTFKVYHKLGPSYLSQPFNRANYNSQSWYTRS